MQNNKQNSTLGFKRTIKYDNSHISGYFFVRRKTVLDICKSDMSRAVVQALLLFCIFTTNGRRIFEETESLHEQFDEVDPRLPEGTFMEDSSGGKIFYSIASVRRFFLPFMKHLNQHMAN